VPTKRRAAPEAPPPGYPLPEGVTLTPDAEGEWTRFTRALPLNEGPRLLFALVDSPGLRRRLADHLTRALRADGSEVARLDFDTAHHQPLQEIFDAAAAHPNARFCFLSGLELSFNSPEHRSSAFADLNLHRDQISRRLACPLVIWTTDDAFTDLARNAPDFVAWRSGVFAFIDPCSADEAAYRKHLIDRFSKLTLYSVTSDAPLAVDLERVFVKLTATQRRTRIETRLGAIYSAGDPNQDDLPLVYTADDLDLDDVPLPPPGVQALPVPPRLAEEVTVTLSVGEALREQPCLAIIGAPGAGKTTLLRYLTLTFARHQAQERLGLDEDRLPILIALRDFNRFLNHIAENNPNEEFARLLPRFLHGHYAAVAPHLALQAEFFDKALADGRCVVLLDGLDEVADPGRRDRVATAIAYFARCYRGNRFVITSRPRGYESEARRRLAPLCSECRLRDFDGDDRTAFARAWYTAVITDRLGDTPPARDEAERAAGDLLRAIEKDPRIAALAGNPLLLSVLAMVHQRGAGGLPHRRVELYEECCELLLGYWDQVRGGEAARELANYGGLTRSEKRALLEPIALWLHERGELGLEVEQHELEEEISRQFRELFGDADPRSRERAALFLRVITERAGLLIERERGVYAFAHLTFQECLAARALADREDYIAYTLNHLHEPWWREVILLEVGHVSSPNNRRSRKLATDLLRALRGANSWLEPVLKRDLLFASRALADVGPLGVDDDLRQSLVTELIDLWHTTPYEPQRAEVVEVFAYAMPTADGPRVRAELLHCLADEVETMRIRAATALGQIGGPVASPAVLDHLLDLTADPSGTVRSWAAEALGRIGEQAASPQVLERLLDLIADPSRTVRWVATEALGQIGEQAASPTVLDRLLVLTANPDGRVCSWAARALGRIGGQAAMQTVADCLLALTAHADWGVRRAATEALGHVSEKAAAPKVVDRLLVLTADPDGGVRRAATKALGRIDEQAASPQILERLLDLIADPSRIVRWVATEALGRIGERAALPAAPDRLLILTAHADGGVRRAATEALGQVGEKAATPKVLDRLLALTADPDGGVRWAATKALGQVGEQAATPKVLDRLAALIADSSGTVRRTAAEALGRIGERAALPALLDRLLILTAHADGEMRRAATEALGQVGEKAATPKVLDRLLALITDTDEDVRWAAATSLARIGATAKAEIVTRMAAFWQSQLADEEFRSFGERFGQAADLAYEQLRQIAERHGAHLAAADQHEAGLSAGSVS
jgi:HEAT repeat protein